MPKTTTSSTRGWRILERYAYVPRSYEDTWVWLATHLSTLGDPLPGGGRSIELHIRPGGREISRPVRLQVGGLVCADGSARAALAWADAAHPRLFPKLTAVLEIVPLPNEARPFTQIGVQARYQPPLGPVGTVGDHLVGGEVADAVITNFLDELVDAVMNAVPVPSRPEDRVVDLGESDNPSLRRLFLTVDGLAVRPGGAAGVHDTLLSLPGVVRADIDPWTGLIAVGHDPTRCGLEELTDALERRAAGSPPP
jgi:hypothetical protein